MTALFRPWGDGGAPQGVPAPGEGTGARAGAGAGAVADATTVTAWHMAHRMDLAPGGSWSGVRQAEQSTSIDDIVQGNERNGRPKKGRGSKGKRVPGGRERRREESDVYGLDWHKSLR